MAQFDPAVEFVLKHEGGYSNNSSDPGGETNFGITKRDHPNEDIKNLTKARAKEIYFEKYWKLRGYDHIASQKLANKLFDMAVNMGTINAIKHLQKAINYILPRHNELVVDGIMGPKTLVQVNTIDNDLLLMTLRAYHAQWYIQLVEGPDIRFETFAKGWMRRVFA